MTTPDIFQPAFHWESANFWNTSQICQFWNGKYNSSVITKKKNLKIFLVQNFNILDLFKNNISNSNFFLLFRTINFYSLVSSAFKLYCYSGFNIILYLSSQTMVYIWKKIKNHLETAAMTFKQQLLKLSSFRILRKVLKSIERM